MNHFETVVFNLGKELEPMILPFLCCGKLLLFYSHELSFSSLINDIEFMNHFYYFILMTSHVHCNHLSYYINYICISSTRKEYTSQYYASKL